MSVGALEPQFFSEFIDVLGLDDLSQSDADSEEIKQKITKAFKSKTQNEWSTLFEKVDACVFPVLDWQNADLHSHNIERKTFVKKEITDGTVVPSPAPLLSRTPAISGMESKQKNDVNYMEQVEQIFKEIGLEIKDMEQMQAEGVLITPTQSKL